jgi:hypothetical protein
MALHSKCVGVYLLVTVRMCRDEPVMKESGRRYDREERNRTGGSSGWRDVERSREPRQESGSGWRDIEPVRRERREGSREYQVTSRPSAKCAWTD